MLTQKDDSFFQSGKNQPASNRKRPNTGSLNNSGIRGVSTSKDKTNEITLQPQITKVNARPQHHRSSSNKYPLTVAPSPTFQGTPNFPTQTPKAVAPQGKIFNSKVLGGPSANEYLQYDLSN